MHLKLKAMLAGVALCVPLTALSKHEDMVAARQKFFGSENVNSHTGAVAKDKVITSWLTNTSFAASFRGHLRRFPSVTNGLGAIENTGLRLIKSGSSTFTDLFARFGEAQSLYGLGDAQFWLALRRMCVARQPMVTTGGLNGNYPGWTLTPSKLQNASFKITDVGESVLRGEADFVSLNGIDIWLGGVHLDDVERLWRWDEQSGRLECK